MIGVRFLREAAPYAKGEVAGFREERADRLCKAGIAERVVQADNEAVRETVSQSASDVPAATGPNKARSRPAR